MSLPKIGAGKVRELYDAGPDLILMVATDQISAFDVVLPDRIPDKGRVLTALSLFWFSKVDSIVPTHLITSDPGRFPAGSRDLDDLPGRSMLVGRAEMLPIEFIVRGYLYGSGFSEYKKSGTVSGIPLPEGLDLASKLEEPLVTPTTKADVGHDEAITPAEAAALCVGDSYERAAAAAVDVYNAAHAVASDRGVLIADTKFEFGLIEGEVTLADEVLTPDSSRFWPASGYEPGQEQPSFDKQFVRDFLDSTGWDRVAPAPRLPQDVIEKTSEKYIEAYELLTGRKFADYVKSFE